ncbi:GNAT family N-acetyltransferase [Pseudoalteromonas xiamenensis]|uniref:GNAT family N-acetyltransferase n=1 Tax=Pseudoalteromonas xiamenensis TaxID=882626 RepID=UPI0027E44AFF|nr:GNAT family N-acetyltransferase [Pseudoalteromonas xiamenensis]WMN61505.1 GNAT family N-acetyltransferase [Pseudoalteromonas xiamenensis]
MGISSIETSDWEDILAIQSQVYFDVEPESLETLLSKWRTSPDLCFVFRDEKGVPIAYILAHQWNDSRPPSLYTSTTKNEGTMLFIHDLAVSTRGSGRSIGQQLVQAVLQAAKASGLKEAMLISIQNSQGFWSRFEFKRVGVARLPTTYGEHAVLMKRDLLK